MMKKVEFLLTKSLDKISYDDLKEVKDEYFELLKKNKFPDPEKDADFYYFIQFYKRKNEKKPNSIGPYKNITVFEAANRIASDLVIINGLLQLVEEKPHLKEAKFTLRLGTTHVQNKGDFTIHISQDNDQEGEAFNVAPTFLKAKLYKTKTKWSKDARLSYIFINEEAFVKENHIIDENSHAKKEPFIIKVKNWNL